MLELSVTYKFIKNNLRNSFRKYFHFKGRASRSEFWIFQIFYIIITFVPFLIFFGLEMYYLNQGRSLIINLDFLVAEGLNETQILKKWEEIFEIWTWSLILPVLALTIIPYSTVAVRRLHDFGKSGYYYLFYIIIFVGLEGFNEMYPDTNEYNFLFVLISLFFYIYISRKPDKKKNKFGAVPKKIK
tara:strand:+ start:1726 stop:2283 length:558 start_codon:yes stop_codon:yes gene_type:complete